MKTILRSALLLTAACVLNAQTEVIATGLQEPQKFIITPRGNFLVSETSVEPHKGRLSFVSRSGDRRTLLAGLPSGLDAVGGGSGPTALALRDRTLYLAIGLGDTERRSSTGVLIHNPEGSSSPLFAKVLRLTLSGDIDTLTASFTLTPAQQQTIADGDEVTLDGGAGASLRIAMLAQLPVSVPEGNGYRFSNPWGLALSDDGNTLWLVDASQNSLYQIATASGRWQRILRFPAIPNPTPIGPPVVEAVPTNVRVYGDQLLVSFLTGFPFAPENARVLAINPSTRSTEPFLFGLTSAVDILHRDRPGASRAQFWALEFSRNQLANPAEPGRLWRYDTNNPVLAAGDLQAPVSLAFDPATEEIFILELTGRIRKVSAR
jgi:glucose/arabinose dehydrogenase